MAELLERIATLLLCALVLLRIPTAIRDPRARPFWFATLFGAIGMLFRGALIPAADMDGILGGHNWLNLLQNLAATAAFWFGARTIAALVKGRTPHTYFIALVAASVAITVPFAFIRKGDHTDGRAFILMHIDQFAMFAYVVIYMSCVGALAAVLLLGIRHRSSRFYIPFRIGATLVILACADEIVFAAAAHWRLFPPGVWQFIDWLFEPLFYPGLMLVTLASFLFAAARSWQRRRARHLTLMLDPRALPRGRDDDGELATLYNTVVRLRDQQTGTTGPMSTALGKAESVLSHYLVLQVPNFRRPITYRPR
ncbi:hypothetical protein [Rathayibacter soli]|uniref:hypothetical protein n=1 Tax=Rathayibacter soli TaxID=3144168 RepID=UPI0027E42526|nr:hypothetical protein [Glaciibacter superstes]